MSAPVEFLALKIKPLTRLKYGLQNENGGHRLHPLKRPMAMDGRRGGRASALRLKT